MTTQDTGTPRTTRAKPKLAIISTYDELCGIAGYTRALVDYISEDFEIEVFDLDQYLLRSRGGRRAKLGDAQIAEICARVAEFDAVNLQLEYGTLGPEYPDILRRFRMILQAAPRLSVTFHTILPSRPFPTDDLRRHAFRFELWNSYAVIRDWRAARRFRSDIYHSLRETQKTKPLSIIVHTKRDARDMEVAERFDHVFGHPLAFLPKERALALAPRAVRSAFEGLEDLPDQTKLIGVFGFVNTYKGIHTAIRALSLLPEDHHLAIFGGLHPGEIRPEMGGETHPYIERLLGEAHVGETLLDAMGGNGSAQVDVTAVRGSNDPAAFIRSPRDMGGRVHFMGVQDDDGLAAAMGMVDVVVLPYQEIGQASSGPMSIAVEMGARIVASRNHAFLQFDRFNPGRVRFFDIGNHLELAQRVRQALRSEAPVPAAVTSTETNRDVYRRAHDVLIRTGSDV